MMKPGIKKFILRSLLALSPVAAYVGLYAALDPFKVIKPDAGSTTVTCNADVVTYCDTSEERPYMKYIAIDKKTVNAANKAKATYETAIEASKSEVLLGDINKDGVVDIQDATMLQRYLAEYITSIDKTAADVNRDGKVNVRDLTQIQRYLAKYISSF